MVKIILFLLTPLMTIVGYSPVIFGFFQQDEWLAFGRHFELQNESLGTLLYNIFIAPGGHYNPLNFLTIHALFAIFQVHYMSYALLSIFLQIIAVMLVFYLANLIFKEFKLALLTSLIFGVMAADYQATSWTVADISIHGSAIFAILSLIFCLLLIKYQQIKFLLFSLGSLIVSFLFKEIALAYFIILPLVIYLFSKNLGKGEMRHIKIIFLTGILLVSIRVIISLTGSTNFSFSQNTLYNFLTVPITSVSQTLLPQEQFRNLIINTNLQILKYFKLDITDNNLLARGEKTVTFVGYSLISMFIFILTALVAVFNKRNNSYLVKASLFGLLFMVLNSFVFVLSPERTDKMIVIDSRNLYLPALGFAIYLTSMASILRKKRFLIMWIVILFIVLNTYWLYSSNRNLRLQGEERKFILTNIKNSYPTLPKQAVFYTESDTSFYGLPPTERILPFQSGFGQTLLVWYQLSENFPKEFFQNKFLWEIKDQGYAEFEGRGFGYFRDFSSLARLLQDKKLPSESVIAFRYDLSQGSVQDITKEVQGRLEGYRVVKSAVDRAGLIISASNNSEDAWMAIDGDRRTVWDSKLPYNRPQYFEIDLSKAMTIAQITIDTYNNVNQNQVGFAVSLSSDGKTWKDVFYVRRYPPDEKGYINIYFKPQLARFIKISQIGSHVYANWVIHDLKIYEKSS